MRGDPERRRKLVIRIDLFLWKLLKLRWPEAHPFFSAVEPIEAQALLRAELVVGVSGYTVRPPEARRKPHVSSFLDANFDRILELKPDVVIGFSDLQADLGRELCKRGVPVILFNQRSVAEILQTIRVTCAVVG